MNRKTLIFLSLAGLSDAATGLILMFAPQWTLHLMGVQRIPADLVYIQFIGAFVFAFGVACQRPWLWPAPGPRTACLRHTLSFTSWIRCCIAVFCTVAIARGLLAPEWFSVPLFDFLVAAVQLVLLRAIPSEHA